MYRPNFCAECGEAITRLRWRVWTSRRFCEACEKRFRTGRVMWPVVACVALVASGFIGGRAMRPATPPLVIERGATNSPALLSQTPKTAGKQPSASVNAANGNAANGNAGAPVYGADGTDGERPTEAGEIVSICGARTKRGTPCSRRVRGTGRCWQHRGRAAMLPAAKLLVRE
ncbi:MAG TPA: hypothetical protein VGO96_01840 [Pyrinomonadaceae bacterium]|jgi:hypothetical protein|nr:hypothetical protein [Pyrinomonadaceae bacterium]